LRVSRIVCNAGPLIALGILGKLELLQSLFNEVLLPDAVQREILQGGVKLAGLEGFQQAQWNRVIPPKQNDALLATLLDTGEAAFYGPKIDVQVWRCLRTATTSAANSPSPPTRSTSPCPLVAVRKDFGVTYRDKDNSNKTPLCIHRAPLGTHERFIGFLIEHYAGNFPLWLAPD
jgi:hypothetical protein